MAEDRKQFAAILDKVKLRQPRTAPRSAKPKRSSRRRSWVTSADAALVRAGGRGMFILYSEDELKAVVRQVFDVMPGKPVAYRQIPQDATSST